MDQTSVGFIDPYIYVLSRVRLPSRPAVLRGKNFNAGHKLFDKLFIYLPCL